MPPHPRPGHGPGDVQPQKLAARPSTTNNRRRPHNTQAPLMPKPIPPDKLAHALELYTKCLLACHTHTPPESSSSRYLGSTTAPSECSQASQNDPAPEALLSFSGSNLSPVSTTPKGKPIELVAYDGTIVKTRSRKRLTPKARAKAALIRYLGSCESCHGRSVSVCLLNDLWIEIFSDTTQCPMDHHDLAALEEARKVAAFKQQNPEHPTYPLSASTSNSSRYLPQNTSTDQSDDASTFQTDTLMGVGQSVELYEPNMLHIDSLATSIENFNEEIPAPEPAYYVPSESRCTPPFTSQADSAPTKFILGTWRASYYYCNAANGCSKILKDVESLQSHFADAHFTFEHLETPHRFTCLYCNTLNDSYVETCQSCGQATIEVQVWGRFIWDLPQYQPVDQSVIDSDLQSSSSVIPLADEYAVMDLHYGVGPNGRVWTDSTSSDIQSYDSHR